jgi:hypothetical protein
MCQIINRAGFWDFRGRELEKGAAAEICELQIQLRQEMDFVKDRLQISSDELGTLPKKNLDAVKSVTLEVENPNNSVVVDRFVVYINKEDNKIEDIFHRKDTLLTISDGSTIESTLITYGKSEENPGETFFVFDKEVSTCGSTQFDGVLYFKDSTLLEPYKYENHITEKIYFLEA